MDSNSDDMPLIHGMNGLYALLFTYLSKPVEQFVPLRFTQCNWRAIICFHMIVLPFGVFGGLYLQFGIGVGNPVGLTADNVVLFVNIVWIVDCY